LIIFDANVLIQLSTLPEDDDTAQRLAGLVKSLVEAKTVIAIPAPAWAEFLCGTDIATASVIQTLRSRRAVRILPFDEAAAFELSLIQRGAMQSGSKRGNAKGNWQQIKVDRQILAIARVHGIDTVYTADTDMIAEASRLNIEAIRPEDVPLPPKQGAFPWESAPDEGQE
jgi:predicted nucleic acid-binding protein